MFTGITKGLFSISSAQMNDNELHYSVIFNEDLIAGLEIGASVSVDGVCQTVTQIDGLNVYFQAIAETLRVTHFSSMKVGQQVNIERSLRYGDEVGGHLLSGHIFTTGKLITRENNDFTIEVDTSFSPYLIQKGFIAINGVSLTLGDIDKGRFTLHLIDETLRVTNLSSLKIGDFVNVEFDQQLVSIVTTVERYLTERSSFT